MITVFPRGRTQRNPNASRVHVNWPMITRYFHLPLLHAAHCMGISDSTLKKICRKFGLKRWPYRKYPDTSVGAQIDRWLATNSGVWLDCSDFKEGTMEWFKALGPEQQLQHVQREHSSLMEAISKLN